MGNRLPACAGSGWLSESIVAQTSTGQCFTAFTSDESLEAAYLDRVPTAADRGRMDLVTWISDRDLLIAPLMGECGCQEAAEWCTVRELFRGPPPSGTTDTQLAGELLLKAFGTMGLRTYEGTAKPVVHRRWQQALATALRQSLSLNLPVALARAHSLYRRSGDVTSLARALRIVGEARSPSA